MKIASVFATSLLLMSTPLCSGTEGTEDSATVHLRQGRNRELGKVKKFFADFSIMYYKGNRGACQADAQQVCTSEQVSTNNALYNKVFDGVQTPSADDPALQAFFDKVNADKTTDGFELDKELPLTSILFTTVFAKGPFLLAKTTIDRLLPALKTLFPAKQTSNTKVGGESTAVTTTTEVDGLVQASSAQKSATAASLIFFLAPFAIPSLFSAFLLIMLTLLIPLTLKAMSILVPRLFPSVMLENIDVWKRLLGPLIFPFINILTGNANVIGPNDSRMVLLSLETEMQGTFDAINTVLTDMATNGDKSNKSLGELNCRLKALFCERSASLEKALAK